MIDAATEHKLIYGIRTILNFIGDDASREDLLETPKRMIKAWEEMFSGYKDDLESIFKTFDAGQYNEMIISRNIEFTSICEHHFLPFMGVAHVGYIPDRKIIGLSKLARLVDKFSKQMQVQERLTVQITDALMKGLSPRGAGCRIVAKHLCQACRGVKKQNAEMVTTCVRGIFLSEPHVKQEFLQAAV